MPIEFQVHVFFQVAVWSFATGLLAFFLGRWVGSKNTTQPTPTFEEETRRWESAITEFHKLQSKVHNSLAESDTHSLAQFLSHELGLPEDEVLFWAIKILSEMHRHHQRGEPAGYQLKDGRFVHIDHPFPKRISMWPHEE